MIQVRWGDPAQHYILHDYPKGVAEIPEEEIEARVAFAHKQALMWVEVANKIAFEDGGLEKYAFGISRAGVWQKEAEVLQALLS